MSIVSIEERVEREIWEVLKQLKNDWILTPADEYVAYEITTQERPPKYPSNDNQVKIIHKLKSSGILKIKSENYFSVKPHILNSVLDLPQSKPKAFFLDINDEEFERFFSDYQEKHINETDDIESDFYINKKGEDFLYNGKILEISKTALYYKIFCVLFNLLPKGGKISYKDFIEAIQKEVQETRNYTSPRMRKLIPANLTDKSNGFLRYAGIPEVQNNGKKILATERGKGIIFNNRK